MRPCSVQGILHFAFQKDLQGTTFSEICQRNHLNGQLQGGLKITWHLSKSVPLDICHPDSSRAQHPWCYQQLSGSGVQMVISTYRKWGETRGGLGGGIQARHYSLVAPNHAILVVSTGNDWINDH